MQVKIKIDMNVDYDAKNIVNACKTKLGVNQLSQSQRGKKDEKHLYLFKQNAKVEHLAFKKFSDCDFPLRHLQPEIM